MWSGVVHLVVDCSAPPIGRPMFALVSGVRQAHDLQALQSRRWVPDWGQDCFARVAKRKRDDKSRSPPESVCRLGARRRTHEALVRRRTDDGFWASFDRGGRLLNFGATVYYANVMPASAALGLWNGGIVRNLDIDAVHCRHVYIWTWLKMQRGSVL
jgi:hypothetical protein